MKKKIKIIIIGFFLFNLIPLLGMNMPGRKLKLMQNLAPKPDFFLTDGGVNINYLRDLSSYIDDNFFLRDYLINIDSIINKKAFGISRNENVYMGKDNYLFLGQNVDSLRGLNSLDSREIYSIYNNIFLMEEFARNKSIDLYFTLAPNKTSLYPQYTNVKNIKKNNNLERLHSYLKDEQVNYIDLFAPFEKEDETLYYKTDSHWTNKGAALAFDTILKAINKDGFTSLYDKNPAKNYQNQGDLYQMIFPRSKKTESDYDYEDFLEFDYISDYKGPQDMTIETRSKNKDKKLLMYRDSFANYLHKLIANEFETAIFKRATKYDLNSLKDLNLDVIIIELVERNMDYLLKYPPTMNAIAMDMDIEAKEAKEKTKIQVDYKNGTLKIQGYINEDIDYDSPIYLSMKGKYYQAVISYSNERPNGFVIHLDGELDSGDIIYKKNNIYYSSATTIE